MVCFFVCVCVSEMKQKMNMEILLEPLGDYRAGQLTAPGYFRKRPMCPWPGACGFPSSVLIHTTHGLQEKGATGLLVDEVHSRTALGPGIDTY